MFDGYYPETADFLWGIRLNNNREWFQAHKADYTRYVYEPTKALGKALFAPYLEKPGNILKVSRIYRDARMHHSVPYKESLWVCIRPDVDSWDERACLYCEVRPEGIDYGLFFFRPKPARMKGFRSRITEKPEDFLKLIRQVEQSTGVAVTARHYARPAKCDDPRLEQFYLWKDCIECSVHEDYSPAVFSPALADRVSDFFQKVTPLYEYLNTVKEIPI